MSYNLKGTSFHNNKMEGEIVGSRPTEYVYLINKNKIK